MSCDDENCESCGHNHEHQQFGTEEIARHNNFLINVLIQTLVKKGVMSEEDLNETVKEIQEAHMNANSEAEKSSE